MSDIDTIRQEHIAQLLIAVADGMPWEDSPRRKAAWDEIKRRDAALSRVEQELADAREALEFYASGTFNYQRARDALAALAAVSQEGKP